MDVAKYMWKASYTLEGARGLAKEGAVSRRAAIEELTKKMGGTLEAFYFAFGEDDVILIADLPDQTTAAAISAAVNLSGAVSLTTVVLLTPDEMDAALHMAVPYRAPGA
jgi:uncharacterized protein with GYD domain